MSLRDDVHPDDQERSYLDRLHEMLGTSPGAEDQANDGSMLERIRMGNLGTFEGKKVTSASLSFLGKDEGFDEVLHDEDEAVFVVKAKIDGIGFKSRKTGMERIHKMKIIGVLVPTKSEGKDFLKRINAERIKREEEALGTEGMIDPEGNVKELHRGRSRGKDSRDKA